jgi:hypothetical protein
MAGLVTEVIMSRPLDHAQLRDLLVRSQEERRRLLPILGALSIVGQLAFVTALAATSSADSRTFLMLCVAGALLCMAVDAEVIRRYRLLPRAVVGSDGTIEISHRGETRRLPILDVVAASTDRGERWVEIRAGGTTTRLAARLFHPRMP